MLNELLLFHAFLAVLGFIAHVLKKSAVEKVSPVEYFVIHKSRTYASISAVIAAFVSLVIFHPEAGAIEFFALGYMADSITNKAPTEIEVAQFRHNKTSKVK